MSLEPPPIIKQPGHRPNEVPPVLRPPSSGTETRRVIGPPNPIVAFFARHRYLLTVGTMLLSVWYYSNRFDWLFSFLFVFGILIHELGHVVFSLYEGVPVTAPIFIPGFGALIIQKKLARSAWAEALIGIGGPMGGTMMGFVFWGVFLLTGNDTFGGVAFMTFFINLFNMLPMFPLDGGRIVGAVSPYLWLLGILALGGLAFLGLMNNPVIWIIVIMSFPQVLNGIKRGTADPVGGQVTTKKQRLIMGVAYCTLSAVLFVSLICTSRSVLAISRPEPAQQEFQPT